MKDYFNLSTEERRELRSKRDSRPERFAKPVTVETTTTLNIITDEPK